MRNRAWRRWKNFTKARRKYELDKELTMPLPDHTNGSLRQWLFYKNLHEYSKGKIHCSCPMCSAKTKNKGKKRLKHGNYSPSINYKISEKRKIDSMRDKIKNYEDEFLI